MKVPKCFPSASYRSTLGLPSGFSIPTFTPPAAEVEKFSASSRPAKTSGFVIACGQLSQNQLSGGTFTISNLGMYGIDGAPAARWL